MACPLAQTEDGFEMQLGTNHLGHFLLSKYLLALVEKGADMRIVNLSSLAHHRSQVDFDDPHFRNRRSEEHTSELQSLMRTSYAVFCLTKTKIRPHHPPTYPTTNQLN